MGRLEPIAMEGGEAGADFKAVVDVRFATQLISMIITSARSQASTLL